MRPRSTPQDPGRDGFWLDRGRVVVFCERDRSILCAGPMVRIHPPPAGSPANFDVVHYQRACRVLTGTMEFR